MKLKYWFVEQILLSISNEHLNIDNKITEQEVLLRLDATVNELAQKNYFDNWKYGGHGVDDQYLTSFEVTVTDRDGDRPSYFALPANYAALPRNGGIVEIYPLKWNTEHQASVVVMSHEDYRRYLSNPASNLQGRLGGYPKWPNFEFTTCSVAKKYGDTFGVRLVIRDSSQIAEDQPYGIPADKENFVIATCVEWYRLKREVPADTVRDNKDRP